MNKDNTIPSSLKEEIEKAAKEHFPIDFEKLPTHSEESDFIQEQQMVLNDAIFNKQQGFIKGANWYAQQLQSPGTSDAERWIPITEAFPDYDDYVLWYLEDGNMFVEALDKDGNPWLLQSDADESENDWGPHPKATHWRKLPEGPNTEL